jgi:hypothetical protein
MKSCECKEEVEHKGHLCVLASESKIDEIRERVKNPQYMCFNCGRVADAEQSLCNPMPLKS